MYLSFLHPIQGLVAHFLLGPTHISFSHRATVYLTIHLVKDNLVVTKFGQWQTKLL